MKLRNDLLKAIGYQLKNIQSDVKTKQTRLTANELRAIQQNLINIQIILKTN